MKKVSSLMLLFICWTAFNCSSSDPNPNANPNPGGGDLTITSITPEFIYADEEITINGTGFSTDPTKNYVEMGNPSGTFYGFQVSDPTDPDPTLPYFTVVSATATKLVVKTKNAVAQKTLNNQFYEDHPYRVRVTVNGKSAMGAIQHAKRLLSFGLSYSNAVNQVIGCNYYIQAGDSVHMTGVGFYGACSVVIDGKPITPVQVKSSKELRFLIPRLHFGELDDDCFAPKVKVKVTNGDGKFMEQDIYISQSPPMKVYSAAFSKSEYVAGETPTLTITGYCLYGTAQIHVNNNVANGYSAIGSFSVHNYPDQVILEVGADNGPGVYNVQIRKKETDNFGFTIASFKMK